MGGLRKTLCQIAVCLTTIAQAPVTAAESPDPMPLFATCTGRLSAVMEFQWLVQDAESDETQARRDAMAELLAVVTRPGEAPRAMALRIEAKRAVAQLLHRARFGTAGPGADWAKKRAARLLADCAALMVS